MSYYSIFILVIIFYHSAYAQSIGYIHRDSVLNSVPGYKVNLTSLISSEKAYDKELKEANQALDQKFQSLVGSYKLTQGETVEVLKKRMKAKDTISLNLLMAEEKMLDQKARAYRAMLQDKQITEILPILDAVNREIVKYTKLNKYDAIYAIEAVGSQLVFVSDSKVITEPSIKIVSKLNILK